ncbi:MAG: hypothetical protein L7F77_14555, partial [Candidatus Magnetominusculus sp. LBB02]|nr:hypothetical protein [Candidatus Magnetominusculus sp. LBB02]
MPKQTAKARVYVNIEDTNEAVEIDSNALSVTRRYALNPSEEPTGMGIDAENHRIFSGCHNKLMVVLDTVSGKVIASLPIDEGVDGNGFDAGTGLALSANGTGTLTVVRETTGGKFEAIDSVPTQRGARTMAIDTKTHNIYLPTAPSLRHPHRQHQTAKNNAPYRLIPSCNHRGKEISIVRHS